MYSTHAYTQSSEMSSDKPVAICRASLRSYQTARSRTCINRYDDRTFGYVTVCDEDESLVASARFVIHKINRERQRWTEGRERGKEGEREREGKRGERARCISRAHAE